MGHLVDELHDLLRHPHPLQVDDRAGRTLEARPSTTARGWEVSGSPPQRVSSSGELIWLLLQRCRKRDLWELIDRSRYRVLFPRGSSLEWAPPPLEGWRAPARWRASPAVAGEEGGLGAGKEQRVRLHHQIAVLHREGEHHVAGAEVCAAALLAEVAEDQLAHPVFA